ncbi:hypothetical protein ACS0TY_015742 [Phlomoides rotata]
MEFINSFNQTIALTIPVLAIFIQLKDIHPFSTHPKTMHLTVSATILFYLAYTALLRFSLRCRSAVIAYHCLHSIGNAAIASLASVLLPDSLSPFVFVVFGLLSAVEFRYWLSHELDGVGRLRFFSNIWTTFSVGRLRFFNNMWTSFSDFTGQRQPILPLYISRDYLNPPLDILLPHVFGSGS